MDTVVAQGDYFKVPVPASAPTESNQALCEVLKKDLFYAFKSTAAEAVPVPLHLDSTFKFERSKPTDLRLLNTSISSKEKLANLSYDRTTVYTVAAANPERCEPTWCGVEGVISDEREDNAPIPIHRAITKRATAGYRYYSSFSLDIDRSGWLLDSTFWTKMTLFSFPVARDPKGQCQCQTLMTKSPPVHGSNIDEVLPSRDWIVPPSDQRITDGKYSKGLCPSS